MSYMFQKPPADFGSIKPRPYQEEATESLDNYIREKETNPCVVIPTGGGKSILIAWIIQHWKLEYPPFRCIILAHRKELVRQNAEELRDLWPCGDIGIYSAGLGKRDEDNSITYASIDSVYDKWGIFPPFDCIIIDEAHRIPVRGEGKYRQFIKGCRFLNEDVKVVGFTATPFRMGSGPICHKDFILNEICYEANIRDLIYQGYLCRLRSKCGITQPDVENVKRNSGGDYIVKHLAAAVDNQKLVELAVSEAMKFIIAEKRKSVIWFCVDVSHCKHVSEELARRGVRAPYVTAKTSAYERDKTVDQFKDGHINHLCNVNVYTEGFNAKRVDCIVLLRPTLSKGLYLQMIGRGLRQHPSKEDCLILDFAHCIDQHGPVDLVEAGEVRMFTCKECRTVFAKAIRICPDCGWEIPKEVLEKIEKEEREKKMHDWKMSNRNVLSGEPETFEVNEVFVYRHCKPESPDSIRVEYRCGILVFREWICLDHGGYAERKARKWWADRFGLGTAKEIDVDTALFDNMFLAEQLNNMTASITVRKRGKFDEIVKHNIIAEWGNGR